MAAPLDCSRIPVEFRKFSNEFLDFVHMHPQVRKRSNPRDQLRIAVLSLLNSQDVAGPDQDEADAVIPRHWEMFEDLVLLPATSFQSPVWDSVASLLWPVVADTFHVSRVARHGRIQSDQFRSPRLEMLLGADTWVRKKENGVVYELDLAKSMFSSGNVTEKARMMSTDCAGETVVDLFAGIGYFTIPLLKAGAEKVFACEWNPDAVTALRRNLQLNQVAERCDVLFGDNRNVRFFSAKRKMKKFTKTPFFGKYQKIHGWKIPKKSRNQTSY
jgi:tRNA G37 N-methylase Trm5